MSTVITEVSNQETIQEMLQLILELLEEVWQDETCPEEAHHFLLTHMRSRLLVFINPKASKNVLDEFEGHLASPSNASAERRARRIMECIRERQKVKKT